MEKNKAFMTEILRLDPVTSTPVPPLSSVSTESLVWSILQAADERKADDINVLKVTDISYLADYFVIVTGFSRTQVRAIADSIEKQVETSYARLPLHTEGKAEGNWILQDFGDVLVHIFMPEEREFYKLEAFWGHAQGYHLADFAQEFGFTYTPPTLPSFQ